MALKFLLLEALIAWFMAGITWTIALWPMPKKTDLIDELDMTK